MLGKLNGKAGTGLKILVSAGIVFEIIAYACSSPQTAHLNAGKRAPTLMLYVHIGQGLSVFYLGLTVLAEGKDAMPYLIGGGSAMAITEVLYKYAMNAGLNEIGQPGTEDW